MTVSENIHNLRRVKIHFDNEKDEENGFYELMVSGTPAIALDNGRYLVNALQRTASIIYQTPMNETS